MKSTALLTMTEGKLKIMMLIIFLSLSILRHQILFADTAIIYPLQNDYYTGTTVDFIMIFQSFLDIQSDLRKVFIENNKPDLTLIQ